MPVSADEIHCSACGNMLIGNANHSRPSAATRVQSLRTIGLRAPGTRLRVRNPIAMRMNVTPSGGTAVSPSAMKRNEAPQITPGRTMSSQSITGSIIAAVRPTRRGTRESGLAADSAGAAAGRAVAPAAMTSCTKRSCSITGADSTNG